MRNSGSGRSPRAVPHEYQQLNSSRSLGADSPDFAVSFEDMVVHSRTGGERRRIVGHATGCVRSGQLLAIIGPPTQAEMFLHALRGVYPTPASGVAPGDGVQVTGTVSWNGQNPSEVDPRVLAFIDLSDGAASAVPPWCSAWDVLLVTIRVRVTFLSSSEQSAMVDQVLDMLQLSEVGATPFGELGPVQQRLVLLARAIVGCSGIVFIHNPIGGLEPADARVLLSSLKLFASAHGYAITVAIPGEVQAGCVALLPDVIVLASDGRVAYQGAADRAAHTLAKAGLARAPDHSSADLLVHGVRALAPAHLDALVVANADGDACRAARRAAVEVRTSAAGTLPALVARGAMPEADRGDMRWLVALLEAEMHLVFQDPAWWRHVVVYPLLLVGVLAVLFPFPAGDPAKTALLGTLLALSTLDALSPLSSSFSSLLDGPASATSGGGVEASGVGASGQWASGQGRGAGWGGALERRVMWEDVRTGRMSLLVHTMAVAVGEGFFRRAPPALITSAGVYLLCGWRFDAASPLLEAWLVVIVATFAITLLPLVYSVVMVGLAPRLSGVRLGSVPAVALCKLFGLGILALLYYAGGFPLAPASIPPYLMWLRALSPYAFVWDALASTQFPGAAAALGFPQGGGTWSASGPPAQMLLLLTISLLSLLLALLLSPSPPNAAPSAPAERVSAYVSARLLSAVDVSVAFANSCLGRDAKSPASAEGGSAGGPWEDGPPMGGGGRGVPPPDPAGLQGGRDEGGGPGYHV